MTGFRIAEVLSLQTSSVRRAGKLVTKIGVAPRHLKGGYGRTRWVPVLPELQRALTCYLGRLERHWELEDDMPLFLSRQGNRDGTVRALTTESARLILHSAFRQAGIENDCRVGMPRDLFQFADSRQTRSAASNPSQLRDQLQSGARRE